MAHLNREDLLTPMLLKLATDRSELAYSLVLQAGGQKYRLRTSIYSEIIFSLKLWNVVAFKNYTSKFI